MPVLPINWDIDPEMINILIKKEREEQNNAHERPFLQLPIPLSIEEIPKNDENDTIIIDL